MHSTLGCRWKGRACAVRDDHRHLRRDEELSGDTSMLKGEARDPRAAVRFECRCYAQSFALTPSTPPRKSHIAKKDLRMTFPPLSGLSFVQACRKRHRLALGPDSSDRTAPFSRLRVAVPGVCSDLFRARATIPAHVFPGCRRSALASHSATRVLLFLPPSYAPRRASSRLRLASLSERRSVHPGSQKRVTTPAARCQSQHRARLRRD